VIPMLRLLERVHGHVGWLAVAALLHPAILLRDPRRRARLAVSLTTCAVAVTALLGATIYPDYRARVKQRIFLEAPTLGWMFERKEHLAVGVVLFALVGCAAHLGVTLFTEPAARAAVARLSHRAFVVSFVMALAVATIGVAVASFKSF
jgi:hypothetical protein